MQDKLIFPQIILTFPNKNSDEVSPEKKLKVRLIKYLTLAYPYITDNSILETLEVFKI